MRGTRDISLLLSNPARARGLAGVSAAPSGFEDKLGLTLELSVLSPRPSLIRVDASAARRES